MTFASDVCLIRTFTVRASLETKVQLEMNVLPSGWITDGPGVTVTVPPKAEAASDGPKASQAPTVLASFCAGTGVGFEQPAAKAAQAETKTKIDLMDRTFPMAGV